MDGNKCSNIGKSTEYSNLNKRKSCFTACFEKRNIRRIVIIFCGKVMEKKIVYTVLQLPEKNCIKAMFCSICPFFGSCTFEILLNTCTKFFEKRRLLSSFFVFLLMSLEYKLNRVVTRNIRMKCLRYTSN